MEIKQLVDCKTVLGEGPLWDVAEQKLYWIDSLQPRIFRSDEHGRGVESWDVPAAIGSMALRTTGGAILSLVDGFHLFNFAAGTATPLQHVAHAAANMRINDGKVDRQGRFVAGSMDMTEAAPSGQIYSIGKDHVVTPIMGGITVTNGPCWSPDGKRFYVSDSAARTIWAHDYDLDTGRAANKRAFCTFVPEGGMPDGATVDADGFLWSAGVFAGKLYRYAPDGSRVLTIDLPVMCGTSVMFGGPGLDRLYVTSMLRPTLPGIIETGSMAGSIFVIDGLGIKGLPENRFDG